MKISDREKLMLAVLGAIAILALSYFVLFQPQLTKIGNLILERVEIKAKVKSTEADIASIPLIESTLLEMEKSVQEKAVKFYPEILQDRIIVILDKLIKNAQVDSPINTFTNVTLVSIQKIAGQKTEELPVKKVVDEYIGYSNKFSNENTETGTDKAGDNSANTGTSGGADDGANANAQANANAGANAGEQKPDVEGMSVTLQIKGSYEQVMKFIKETEKLNRTMTISNLSLVNDAATNLIAGNISMDFYALPKLVEQDKEYLGWPFNNKYGKLNPFVK